VKKFGVRKGVDASADPRLSGGWCSPWRYVNDVDRDVEPAVWGLLDRYGDCVDLSISPGDEGLIFIAAFLAQNTAYRTNVLRWTSALFSRSERLDEAAGLAPSVGNSYQLRRLPAALSAYLSAGPRDRADLLRIPGVGPKVAGLYLLFTGNTSAVPVDRHLMRQAPAWGWQAARQEILRQIRLRCLPSGVHLPEGERRPQAGQIAGWVQTVLYMPDKGIKPEARRPWSRPWRPASP